MWIKVLAQAGLLTGLGAGMGFGFNAVRSSSLPLRNAEPYTIYQECPEMSKKAEGVKIAALPADLSSPWVVIDVRPRKEYEAGHIPGSRSVPYSPLYPLEAGRVKDLRRVPPNRILVVGDRELNSGRLLASELASAGLLGVRYLEGGFAAWVEARRPEKEGANP